MTPSTPTRAKHYRISFERRIEGIAFVAALSRFLSSPAGAPYLSRADVVEVRGHAIGGEQLELYLSTPALDAAMAAFSPLPASEAVWSDALPKACVLLIQGSVPAWGVDDAQIHFTRRLSEPEPLPGVSIAEVSVSAVPA